MATVGVCLPEDVMVLVRGRDFHWQVVLGDCDDRDAEFPRGELFYEFADGSRWDFTVDGSRAYIKVESEVADQMPNRTRWQLVFLPEGEAAGGIPWARGYVKAVK